MPRIIHTRCWLRSRCSTELDGVLLGVGCVVETRSLGEAAAEEAMEENGDFGSPGVPGVCNVE